MIERDSEIRALVVGGYGGIAPSHIGAMEEVPGIGLAAIVGRDAAKTEAAAKRLGVPGYVDIEAVPLSDYDAVIDCTPNFLHPKFAVYAAEHEKHLMVEKPLASTVEGGEKIVEAFKGKDLIAFVGMTRRYDPEVIEGKRIFDAGEIGELVCYMEKGYIGGPLQVWVPWLVSREQGGGGVQFSMGVHGIDRLEWFTGRKVEAIEYARCDNLVLKRTLPIPCDIEDSSIVLVRLEGNRLALIHNQWIPFTCLSYSMEVIGERGAIMIQFWEGIKVTRSDGTVEERRIHPDTPDWAELMHPGFVNQYKAFVETVQRGGPSPAPLEDGLRHLVLLRELYAKSGYYDGD